MDASQGKRIEWSQPEILLYFDDSYIRMSYPDLIEDGGKYYITETQKNIARIHEIPKLLLDGLFNQWDGRRVATNGLLLNLPAGQPIPNEVRIPKLPEFHQRDLKRADQGGKDLRAGFGLDLWLTLDSLKAGQAILDSRDGAGKGIFVSTADAGTLQIALNDGRGDSSWESDRGAMQAGKLHHVVIIVDGGPTIITFVLDGILCDGGEERQFGWGRFGSNLRTPEGATVAKVSPAIQSLRIYGCSLRTSEAVGNFLAGLVR